MEEEPSVFRNAFLQIVSRIITSTTTFLTTIIIARQFGLLGFGDFAKAVNFVGVFALIVDFGLNAVFLQGILTNRLFRNLLFVRLLLAALVLVVANGISILLPPEQQGSFGFSQSAKLGILVFSFTLLTQAVLITSSSLFQKRQRYDLLVRATTLGSVITLALVMLFSLLVLPLPMVLSAFVFGTGGSCLLALFLTREKVLPLFIDKKASIRLFSQSVPLAMMLLFNLVYFRADIFILSLLRPTEDVGVYGFSYRFFDFFIAVPLFLSNALYPLLLRERGNKAFALLVRKYFFVFLAASILIALPAWFAAPLVSFVKSEFAQSVLPFRILLLSLPLFFLTSHLQWVLIAREEQRFLMYAYFFSAALNISLNVVFVPSFSYVASAIITGISEGIVFLLLFGKYCSGRKKFAK